MNELKLSLGQAHELEIALRRAGFSNADVSRMIENEGLCRSILAVLRGQATVENVKHIIDCDATPFIPEGYSIYPEDQIQSRVTGQFEFDFEKVRFFLIDNQKTGHVAGHDIKKALEGQPVLPANVLDFLLANTNLISKMSWPSAAFFWGTIYRNRDGILFVRYLLYGPLHIPNGGFVQIIWSLNDASCGELDPAVIYAS